MRILITGGTGFVGHALCRRLRADGHDLSVVSRRPQEAAVRLGPGITAHGGLAEAWATCEEKPFEAVINLAGASIAGQRWTPERKRILRESRVDLTRELVSLLAGTNVKPQVLISASASGVYGDAGDRELDERAPLGGDFLAALCRDWEAAALKARDIGVRVCVLRIAPVFESSGGMLERLLPIFRLGLGGTLGDGSHWMPWIHRRDLIAAIIYMLQTTDEDGVYNASAPEPVTNREFTRTLGRALGRPTIFCVPRFALRGLYGEMANVLLASQRMVPRRLQASGFGFEFPRLDAALQAITD